MGLSNTHLRNRVRTRLRIGECIDTKLVRIPPKGEGGPHPRYFALCPGPKCQEVAVVRDLSAGNWPSEVKSRDLSAARQEELQ